MAILYSTRCAQEKRFLIGIYMYVKKKYMVMSLYIYACACLGTSLQMRLSLGPSWHKFFSQERYFLTPQGFLLFFTPLEVLETQNDVMPYFEGYVRSYLGQHVNIQCTAGGGFFKKSISQATDFLSTSPDILVYLVPEEHDPLLSATIRTIDLQSGVEWNIKNSALFLNPLLGYAYNQERLRFCFLDIDRSYVLHNIWQGPYIGLEASLSWAPFFMRSFYKWVIGQLHMKMRSHTVPLEFPFIQSSNAPFSYGTASMLGNIFGFEGSYAFYSCWRVGTRFMYEHYANLKSVPVTSVPQQKNLFLKVQFERVRWNQLIWLFFLEYMF